MVPDGEAGPEPRTAVGTAIAAGIATVSIIPLFLLGAVAPQIRAELNLGKPALGTAASVFLGAMLLAGVFGKLVDRTGPVLFMRLAAAGAALTMAATALVAHNYAALLGLMALGGASNAMASPAVNLYLLHAVATRRQGLAYGVKQSAPALAMFLGGLTVPAIALTIGWRWSFGAGALLAAAALLIVREPRPPGSSPTRATPPPRAVRSTVWLLAAAVACGSAANFSLSTFFVDSSVSAGFDNGVAAFLLAGGSLLAIAVRVLAGQLVDRAPRWALPAAAGMMLTGSVGYAIMIAQVPVAVVLGGTLAFGLGWGWPGLVFFAAVHLNPAGPGATAGLISSGVAVGGVIGPMLFGIVAGSTSSGAAWVVAAVLSGLAGLLVAWGWHAGRAPATADSPRVASA